MSPRKNQSIKFKKVLSEDEKKDIISHIEISEKDGYFGPESIISVHKAIVDITIYDQTDLILESRARNF